MYIYMYIYIFENSTHTSNSTQGSWYTTRCYAVCMVARLASLRTRFIAPAVRAGGWPNVLIAALVVGGGWLKRWEAAIVVRVRPEL